MISKTVKQTKNKSDPFESSFEYIIEYFWKQFFHQKIFRTPDMPELDFASNETNGLKTI